MQETRKKGRPANNQVKKNGRPEKPEAEKETKRLNLRFTALEKQHLTSLMLEIDCTNATKFIKDKLFKSSSNQSFLSDKNIRDIYLSLTKYINEYHAIGVNFNQLVKKINSIKETNSLKTDVSDELNSTIKLFNELNNSHSQILNITNKFYEEWSAR